MANYTTQVKSICEFYAGRDTSGSYADIDAIIAKARSKIFTAAYPMYEDGDRAALETKILKHFYFREIGMETVGVWKHFLNTRMMEIMPYYVDYMRQGLNSFSPDGTVNIQRIYHEALNDTGNVTQTDKIDNSSRLEHGLTTVRSGSESVTDDTTRTPDLVHKDKYSDTPQNGLLNVEQDEYLTNYRYVHDGGTEDIETDRTVTYNDVTDENSGVDQTINTGKDVTTVDHGKDIVKDSTDTTTGIASMREYLDIKAKILELIINVDMMIITDLSDLFMRIY